MATYTPRQTDILTQLGRSMGFTLDQITAVSFEADVPINVTYRNSKGDFSRSTYDNLGGVITDAEFQAMRAVRLSQRTSSNFLNFRSLLSLSPSPTATDFVSSSGRALVDTTSTNRSYDPREGRLNAAGLTSGLANAARNITNTVVNFLNGEEDDRVRITDPSGLFINSNNPVLRPLSSQQSGSQIIFPYTPSINISQQANYIEESLTHSNYTYLFYQNSPTATINISATFTAKDASSADYVVAVQHFFRSVTKMFYGQDSQAGVPPPVLRLHGHGQYQFSSVPVVVREFNVSLPTDVDYVTSNNKTRVPTVQDFNITLTPLYSRRSISNDFSLSEFAKGNLLARPNGRGGFI